MKKTEKWVYVKCVQCEKQKFMSHTHLAKLVGDQTEDNFEAIFKCRGCKSDKE